MSDRTCRHKFRLPALPATCLLAAWLSSAPFIESIPIRLILALPTLMLLLSAVNRWRRGRRMLTAREHFKWFLELLLTRISSGATLERAISDTLPGLSQLLGKSADLLSSLTQLDQQLSAGQPLENLLSQLSRNLYCTEARTFFQILPELRRTGGKVDQYIRQHLQMVSEQLALQQDLNAETTQRQTEAMILTLMPFALAALLQQSYDQPALEAMASPAGVAGMMTAYCLALLAAALTLSALGLNPALPSRGISMPGPGAPAGKSMANPVCALYHRMLHHVYRDLLPESYGTRLLKILFGQNIRESATVDSLGCMAGFFNQKFAYLLVGLLPGLIFAYALPGGWIALFILPFFISAMHDQKIFAVQRQQTTEYRLIYPVFLNLCAALLQSGLTLHKTLQICLALPLLPSREASVSFRSHFRFPCRMHAKTKKAGQQPGSLPEDLIMTRRLMQTGLPADQVVEFLSTVCPIPEAQAALLLMQRYSRSGGIETLQMLSMQASACWALYRNTIRKQMEQQSLRLLIPMMLDLIAVVLISLLPAVLSISRL